MAVVTIEPAGAEHQARCITARLKGAVATTRAVIDSYVSYRMQTSASEAEDRRQPATRPLQATKFPGRPVHAEDEDTQRALRPLEPGTISDVIPAFFVGRNHDGLWVAREAKGEVGGIFFFKGSATSFARRLSGSTGCAIIFP